MFETLFILFKDNWNHVLCCRHLFMLYVLLILHMQDTISKYQCLFFLSYWVFIYIAPEQFSLIYILVNS